MAIFSEALSTMGSLQEPEKLQQFAASSHLRPLSDSTEIADTEFGSDTADDSSDDSPHRSIRSLITDSGSSASSPDEATTPDSTGLTGFHFHIDVNPVAGPTGPHLFRSSGETTDGKKQSHDVHLGSKTTPISATDPFYRSASELDPERKDTPVPERVPRQRKQSSTEGERRKTPNSVLDESRAASWTPQDVVMWVQKLGLDESVVEKFFVNDITGSILLDLQSEDLKELDIQSFGKRHRLLNSIRHLRNSTLISSRDSQSQLSSLSSEPVSRESTPQTAMAEVGANCPGSPMTDDSKSSSKTDHRHHRRHHRNHHSNTVVPDGSVSIVAIEQLLPRLHTCSKGEDCRKWQKQQTKLARIARDFPTESITGGGSIALRGDPGNAITAQSLVKSPRSDEGPSLVASSDVFGHSQSYQPCLSEEQLNDIRPRDPQENVRNFLSFQRLSRLQPVNDPSTPPVEMFPSPQDENPNSGKANANLAENLRHLPKLQIPSTHMSMTTSTQSPNLSAQRTITPSILRRKAPFSDQSINDYVDTSVPATAAQSPGDFYRLDSHYGQDTPVSEMDVPLTAIPSGPVERVLSQSVPPNMRFGFQGARAGGQISRPASTKVENHRRNASAIQQPSQALRSCDGAPKLRPIETPEDYERTPRLGNARKSPFGRLGRANDITHSGWMKKRKTTRFMRRDWEENLFALRGTRLAMYADQDSCLANSKALEHIDVDDYAVACSSLPSNSKLTAAFKKTVLKRKDNANGDTTFAFSLIPSVNGTTAVDRKSFFSNGPKSHHFAVKTRDERIDWMRELMLAKALKRGRDSGASVNVNGAVI